jgi:hypothetical protein
MKPRHPAGWAAAAAATAFAVRLTRSRRRRSLHPEGRSFAGELRMTPAGRPFGAVVLDRPARYPVTLRVSKAVGTRGDRLDVRGLAIRVHLPGRDLDLLLDSTGRRIRHLPLPRRSFDTPYGTIVAYRTSHHDKLDLLAEPDPDGPSLGRSVTSVAPGDRLLLSVRRGTEAHTVGRVTFGRPLPPSADAELAFDPVRNSLPDLHPTGFIHTTRAFAYRWSQRWRRAVPAPPDPSAVARTSARR